MSQDSNDLPASNSSSSIEESPSPNSSSSDLKTLIYCDPNLITREATSKLLRKTYGFEILASTSSAGETLSAIDTLTPHLLITEAELPGSSGIELLLEIKNRNKRLKTIVFTNRASELLMKQAMHAGADGFLLKSDEPSELSVCLQQLRANQIYKSKKLVSSSTNPEQLQESVETISLKSSSSEFDPLESLSQREREVFHLLAEGRTNDEISKSLFISPRTVEAHRAKTLKKLGLKNNSEILRFALKNNLTCI